MHFCKARTTVHLTVKACMLARTFPKTRALARLAAAAVAAASQTKPQSEDLYLKMIH